MGSKNLKAVAVRGTALVSSADPDKLKKMMSGCERSCGALRGLPGARGRAGTLRGSTRRGNCRPQQLPQTATFEGSERISGLRITEKYLTGRGTCFACPIACKRKVRVEGTYAVDPVYGGPEYESVAALGSTCEVDDLEAILYANQLCNAYGLDTISTGRDDRVGDGVLRDRETDPAGHRRASRSGSEMPRWWVRLVEMIARREGFGAPSRGR